MWQEEGDSGTGTVTRRTYIYSGQTPPSTRLTVDFMFNLDTALSHVTGREERHFQFFSSLHRFNRSLAAKIQSALFLLLSSEEKL